MFTTSTSRKRNTTVSAGFAVMLTALSICGRSAFADGGEPATPPTVTMVLEPTPTLVLELEPTPTLVLELDPPPSMEVDDITVMPLPGDDDDLELMPLLPEDEVEDSVPGDGPLQALPVDPIVPIVPLDVPEFPEGDDGTTTTPPSPSTTTSPTVDTVETVETVDSTVPADTTDPAPPSAPPANDVGRLPATGGSPDIILVVAGTLLAVGAALSIVLRRSRHEVR